jgi:DMSO/TMAO reductase YedYZ heme-binding membrane subunit
MPEVSAMKHRETRLGEWKPIHRLAFLFLGLMCIAAGTLSLLRGRTYYPNVWGAPVFAPFILFVGFLCLVAALRVWKRIL